MSHWKNNRPNYDGAHYSIFSSIQPFDGMAALREMFPEGEANELNFCLFSTSGVHGHYGLIESAEAYLAGDTEECSDVTFLIVHPRIVTLRYGNVEPKNADDIAFLKKLRASSLKAAASIGVPASTPTGASHDQP